MLRDETAAYFSQTSTRGFTEIERVGPTLPDVLKDNGYFIAQVNKRANRYPWDRNIGEGDDFGRNVTKHGKIFEGLIDASGEKPWFVMLNFNDPHRAFFGADHPAEKRRRPFSTVPSRVYEPDEIVVPGFLPDLPAVRMELAQVSCKRFSLGGTTSSSLTFPIS